MWYINAPKKRPGPVSRKARGSECFSALHHWPALYDAYFGWDAWCFKPTDKQDRIGCGCEGMSSWKPSEQAWCLHREIYACDAHAASVFCKLAYESFWGRWESFAQGWLQLAFTELCVCQQCSTSSLRPLLVSPAALENGSGMPVSRRSQRRTH